MSFDYSQYRHHLDKMSLSREQENALMDMMWKSMGAAAEEAWGFSPIQNIVQEKLEFSLRNSDNSLDSKDSAIKDTFCDLTISDKPERIH